MNIQLNQKDFKKVLEKNNNVIIDFYADWCGPCQMLLPTIEKLAKEYDGEIIIKKVNIDENKELATTFGIKSIPTLLYISNAKVIDRTVGLISESKLRRKINKQKAEHI